MKDDALKHVKAGDPISAKEENRLRDILAGILSSGKNWSTRGLGRRYPLVLGEIWHEGPAAEPDFADGRYWVKVSRVTTTSADVDAALVIGAEDVPEEQIIVAYDFVNLASHALIVGSYVGMRMVKDDGASTRWLIVEKESTGNGARAYLGTGQNIVTGTIVQVLLDTVDFDPASLWDAGNHNFKITAAGYYQINACIQYDAFATLEIMECYIYRNTGIITEGINMTSGPTISLPVSVAASDIAYFDVDDTVEIRTAHSGPLTESVSPQMTYLSLHRIR